MSNSLARVGDIYNEKKEICKETDILPINSVWGQVCSEWNNFELTANSEIQYLQEVRIETVSKSSKNTHRTRKSRKSKVSSIFTSTTENEKYELQKEEAALKFKLAFAEEEQKLKIEQKRAEVLCLEQESKLEALKLRREPAENQARLSVCMKSDHGEANFEECLDQLPPENKEEDIKKFFSSQSLIKLNEHELTEGITSSQTVYVSQDVSFSPVSVGDMSQAYLKDWNLNPASKSVRESYLTPYAKPFTPKDTVTGGIMSVVTPHPEVNPPVSNYLQ